MTSVHADNASTPIRTNRATKLSAAVALTCSLAAGVADAHPFGDYRFLEADNDPVKEDLVVVREGEFNGDFQEFQDFTSASGLGVAFSFDRGQTRDVNGAYASRDQYGVYAEARLRKKHRNEAHLDQYSRFRKCSDTASLTLTITSLYIDATDGGAHIPGVNNGDYFLGLEPDNVPQLVGSAHMEVIAYKRGTTFFRAHGVVALNLFVNRQGDERWKRAEFSLANSAGNFWQGAQFTFEPRDVGLPPGERFVYELAAPHRIAVDLASVPTAASCPDADEPPPEDDAGEFTVLVMLRARAETFFFSNIEKSKIEVFIRDPADLDNNDSGIVLEADGLQRGGDPDLFIVPTATDLVPDPDCQQP